MTNIDLFPILFMYRNEKIYIYNIKKVSLIS